MLGRHGGDPESKSRAMYSAACSDRPIRIGHMPPSESGAPERLAGFGLGFQIGQTDVAQHVGVKL
jgi:hypothetical protein